MPDSDANEHARVLHITRDYPPQLIGGISTAVSGLCGALCDAGHAVSVISFDAWRPRTHSPEAARPLLVDGVETLRAHDLEDPAVHTWARNFAPDVLHLHHSMLWPCARALREITGAPVVASVHILQHELNALRGIDSTYSSRAQDEVLAHADALVVASNFARKSVEAVHPDATIHTIAWATDVHECEYVATGPVITLGRFADSKGTEDAFRVFIDVLSAHPTRRGVIAGGIPENPRSERKWIERWHALAPSELATRVELAGWLSPAERTRYLAGASVFVSTSRVETFGLSVLEAMAHGLPVVVTDIGAHRELVADAGLPVEADRLATTVSELLTSPDEARVLGARARQRVRDHFTWSRVAPAWTSLYSAVTTPT